MNLTKDERKILLFQKGVLKKRKSNKFSIFEKKIRAVFYISRKIFIFY